MVVLPLVALQLDRHTATETSFNRSAALSTSEIHSACFGFNWTGDEASSIALFIQSNSAI